MPIRLCLVLSNLFMKIWQKIFEANLKHEKPIVWSINEDAVILNEFSVKHLETADVGRNHRCRGQITDVTSGNQPSCFTEEKSVFEKFTKLNHVQKTKINKSGTM